MAKIQVIKRYSLANFGAGWEDAYVRFRAFTVGDVDKYKEFMFGAKTKDDSEEASLARINALVTMLKEKFVDGKVYSEENKGLVSVEADDLTDLPIATVTNIVTFLSQDLATNS